ncbi:cation:dicarboxylase symporter family transporter [Clostridium botulinum]|nr:cation:dicarboxylase symporter family transporter [Clostridium botulinum]QRC54570.1 cation:dicarboxylase symporter family transporter [Clostridium botulinum]HBJ2604121.1 cation:dicarboxylase symporter family transporter [Clostridium botulinum]
MSLKNFGVNKSVASFTIPLGATVTIDGTAIIQGVAA